MISFTASLIAALRKHAPKSFWVLRLYYDDESSFVGISDVDRTLGSNTYYGIANWSPLVNSIDLDEFKVKPTTMDIDIVNTDNVLEGGRFSDFFNSHEFTNRKWQLYQSDENAVWHEDNILATGLISDQINHNEEYVTIKLRDYDDKWHGEIPVERLLEADYPNAPEKNWDKPFPFVYGDFQTDHGTIAYNTYQYQKIKALAIITNKQNDDLTGLTAYPDTETLDEITQVYFYIQDQYAVTDDTPTFNNPDVIFKGTEVKTYTSLTAHEDENTSGSIAGYDNAFDLDGDTDCVWTAGGDNGYIAFAVPESVHTRLGQKISAINIIFTGGYTGVANNIDLKIYFEGGQLITGSVKPLVTGVSNWLLAGALDADDLRGWSFNIDMIRIYASGLTNFELTITEIGIEITYEPDKGLNNYFYHEEEHQNHQAQYEGRGDMRGYRTTERIIGEIDMCYVSCQGRTFGAYIDDNRDNRLAEGGLISNPVYIIEDVMRTERSMVTSDINVVNFDVAMDDLENTFGLDDDQILFRLSQHSLIDSKKFVRDICRQAGLFFSFDNEGKADIFAYRRSYSLVVKTLDFNLLDLNDVRYSRAKDLTNEVEVAYLFDYGSRQNLKSVDFNDDAGLKDATSQGDGSTGYKKVQKEKINGKYIADEATAIGIGQAYIIWKKDRKMIIDVSVGTAIYNDLMKGDVVNVDNWDTSIKAMGDSLTTSTPFMITELAKLPNSMRIELTKVAGTIS